MCFAELGSKIPRSGSAYAYIYATVGEFLAFILGWNVLLEFLVGLSSSTKGLSNHIDKLAGQKIKNWHIQIFPINQIGFNEYADLFCGLIVLIVAGFIFK